MNSDSAGAPRYALNFVSRALLTREAILLATMRADGESWESVRDRAVEENAVQARTHRSGVRLTREAVHRLVVLSDDEIEFLLEASAAERGYLMWAAACRAYPFIGDFAEQVLRERFLLLTPTISPEHLEGFVASQAMWHPELVDLSDSMSRGIRQTVFRMMREADLVTKGGSIVPALLSERLVSLLTAHGRDHLRFFPSRDSVGQGATA